MNTQLKQNNKMKISNILEEKENKLLNRKEIKIVVESEKAPSEKEVIDFISNEKKADKELIKVDRIKGKFGRRTFLLELKIYNSKENMDKVERTEKQETTKKEEKPVEQNTQESTQTEKTEEKPEENKEEVKEEKPEENK